MILSIVICTYNRSHYLKKCLVSLVNQPNIDIEVLVIDNNSMDDTKEVVNNFIKKLPNLRYIFEPSQGLSIARNRGINESHADWILYLDDDTIAFPDLIERALYLINRGDFDCVGGMYYGYYEDEKPKWIPNDYGTKNLYSTTLSACTYNIPCGGIVLYRKSMLEELKGFSSQLGMIGNTKALGEETGLQYRAQQNNYKIGFDPELKVYHLVKSEYTKLSWFLKRAFLEGLASGKIQNKTNLVGLILMFLKSIGGLILIRLPYNFYKFITQKEYFWQIMIYDSFMPNLLFTGKLLAYFKKQKP